MSIKLVATMLLGLVVGVSGFAFINQKFHIKTVESPAATEVENTVATIPTNPVTPVSEVVETTTAVNKTVETKSTLVTSSTKGLNQSELLALADDKYASGNVPLGDYKYTTDAAKKGYIYLCNARKDNPGSMVNGTWMNSDNTWNFLRKVAVSGSVTWPSAVFSNVIASGMRVLTGNGLPINHTTGKFPVQANDPAAKFDPNPNTISAQTLKRSLSSEPVYSDTPYCMGGEVGVMLSGVPLFNGFDAGLRDAAAHELQDSCDGHPQGSGQYHYHSLSSCFKDTNVSTVLGYAFDGFPITGPMVATNKYLTTEDLDICHGLTSEVVIDGQKKVTYHYVMTRDFPYSASCFRAKAISSGPSAGTQSTSQTTQTNQSSAQQSAPGGQGQPPQEAISACSGKSVNSSCSFTGGRGENVSGTCKTPPNSSLACVPS